MHTKKTVLITVFVFLFTLPVLSLEKYGDVTVKRGTLNLLRNGENSEYSGEGQTFVVLLNDVLRVGEDSLVIMKTVQNGVVQMGSNAVFQVKPWKQKKKHGYLRMLYGKAFFKVKKMLASKDSFNVKTGTAVMGVRGTAWKGSVTSNGVAGIKVEEGTVGSTPNGTGYEVLVKKGFEVLNLDPNSTTTPHEFDQSPVSSDKPETQPDEKADTKKEDSNLDSPTPTSKEASSVENQQYYVDNNIVSASDFLESERVTATSDEKIEQPELSKQDDSQDLPADKSEEASEAFNKELQESENVEEVTTEPEVIFEDDDQAENESNSDIALSESPGDDGTEEIDEDINEDIEDDIADDMDDTVEEVFKGNITITFEK